MHDRQALLVQRRTVLELAKQAVTDSRLRAPFAGSVRERHATPGQYLAAGAPVVVIGGQTLSLLLTLLVTPVAYSLIDDLRARVKVRATSRAPVAS